jgi:hypothetical protein
VAGCLPILSHDQAGIKDSRRRKFANTYAHFVAIALLRKKKQALEWGYAMVWAIRTHL